MKITLKKLAKAALPYGVIWLRQEKTKQPKQPRKILDFEVHLVDHCNLNCKGCNNFSPIADKFELDAEEYEKDLKRLSELTYGYCGRILLLGGEPLLHPQAGKIAEITRKYFNSCNIRIVTNGLLLKSMGREFWQMCSKNKIIITVTKYPISLDFGEIERIAKTGRVALDYYNDENTVKTLECIPIDLTGSQNIQENFKNCYKANSCIELYQGRLYPCTLVPFVKYFNKEFGKDLKVSDEDSISIYDAKDIDEILEFLSRPIPFCRYCNINATRDGIIWEPSKKEIAEWI